MDSKGSDRLTRVSRDKMKLRFTVPSGEVSRRELLALAWPRYEVIPYIEADKCRGYEECGLCADSCRLKAIDIEGDEVTVDTTLCSGCGACVEVCPFRAIIYPTFSLEKLDRELEDFLLPKHKPRQPSIIAAFCQRCLPEVVGDEIAHPASPDSLLLLPVPCLAMVSPWLILRAFDMGAQGFVVVSGGSECHSGYDLTRVRDNIRFVQGLLKGWNIETQRVRVFEVAGDGTSDIEDKIGDFARQIAGLGPTPLDISQPTLVPDEGLRLPALIKGIGDKLGNSPEGVVVAGAVPFGRLELAGAKCTGCGLCALNCPTGAMSDLFNEETDVYQILFKHDTCVACGRCIEVCPEKCLSLERILEMDKLGVPATLLFEDSVVRCAQCGVPVGSRSMVDSIRARLIAAGQSPPDEIELCPTCKIRAQFRSWDSGGEPIKPVVS